MKATIKIKIISQYKLTETLIFASILNLDSPVYKLKNYLIQILFIVYGCSLYNKTSGMHYLIDAV